MASAFLLDLLTHLLECCHGYESDNFEPARFSLDEQHVEQLKADDHYWEKLDRDGLHRAHFSMPAAATQLTRLCEMTKVHELVSNLLHDEPSRVLYRQLLLYRVLGQRHVRLPTNTTAYWSAYEEAKHLPRTDEILIASGMELPLYQLEKNGTRLELFNHFLGLLNQFGLEQYTYRSPDDSLLVAAREGDIAIDAGACWGECSIDLARRVGPSGQVFAFEFVPESLSVLQANLERNQTLAERIHVITKALAEISGNELVFKESGPGSRIVDPSQEAGTASVMSVSIDDFVEQQGLPGVDFIKMDIEGSELKALFGAKRTLTAHKPRLAISVYHREDDLFQIPIWLAKLELGYRFFLGHYTIHGEETVLYATAD